MASRASKGDSVWEFTHSNACSFKMHVNHFMFRPITSVLLYGVIADGCRRFRNQTSL